MKELTYNQLTQENKELKSDLKIWNTMRNEPVTITFKKNLELEADNEALKEEVERLKTLISIEEIGESGLVVKLQSELAAISDQNGRMREIFAWLQGYSDFPERKEGEGAYWWRRELNRRLEALPFPNSVEVLRAKEEAVKQL